MTRLSISPPLALLASAAALSPGCAGRPPSSAAFGLLSGIDPQVQFQSWSQEDDPVRLYVADDGYWYLGGTSGQAEVAAECVIIRYGPGAMPHSVQFRTWLHNEPSVRLMPATQGLCVLTAVAGKFLVPRWDARLYIDRSGYWRLGGESHQAGVAAECVVLPYSP